MAHIDPEMLALTALGEPVATRAQAAHLAECPECAADLAGLRRATIAARATLDVGELERPRDVVWDRIAAELALTSATSSPSPSGEAPTPSGEAPDVPPPARTRSVRRSAAAMWWALAAAAVVVAGAGFGVWVWAASLSAPGELAEASLVAFPAHPGAVGSAFVEQNDDGSRSLRVEVSADAAPDTYREVWLIASDASDLVSLGVLDGDTAVLEVPAGVDLARFPLVDVSQEPVDGDPAHSGDSIVRGALSFR